MNGGQKSAPKGRQIAFIRGIVTDMLSPLSPAKAKTEMLNATGIGKLILYSLNGLNDSMAFESEIK